MGITKVTIVDSPEKMRPQKTPTKEYSNLMDKNLRETSDKDNSELETDAPTKDTKE